MTGKRLLNTQMCFYCFTKVILHGKKVPFLTSQRAKYFKNWQFKSLSKYISYLWGFAGRQEEAHFVRKPLSSKSRHWKWWEEIDTTILHSFNAMCWKPSMKDHHWSDRWALVLLWPCGGFLKLQREDEDPCFLNRSEELIHRLEQVYMGPAVAWKLVWVFLWQWINVSVDHKRRKKKNSVWQKAWNYLRTGPMVPRVETLSSFTCGGLWHVEKHRSHRLPCFDHTIHLSESESRPSSEGASMFHLETSLIKSNKH